VSDHGISEKDSLVTKRLRRSRGNIARKGNAGERSIFQRQTAAGAPSLIWDGKAESAGANTCTAPQLRRCGMRYSKRAPLAPRGFRSQPIVRPSQRSRPAGSKTTPDLASPNPSLFCPKAVAQALHLPRNWLIVWWWLIRGRFNLTPPQLT
jgi:hypothetical protein